MTWGPACTETQAQSVLYSNHSDIRPENTGSPMPVAFRGRPGYAQFLSAINPLILTCPSDLDHRVLGCRTVLWLLPERRS